MKTDSYKLFFHSFSNSTRLEIIKLLRKSPKHVSDICKELGFEQSRVSHNLKCLVDCGFVSAKRNGKNNVYSLDGKHIVPILNNIDDHIEKYNKRLRACGLLN